MSEVFRGNSSTRVCVCMCVCASPRVSVACGLDAVWAVYALAHVLPCGVSKTVIHAEAAPLGHSLCLGRHAISVRDAATRAAKTATTTTDAMTTTAAALLSIMFSAYSAHSAIMSISR